MEGAQREPPEYAELSAELERRAEEHAPGVLDVLNAYDRSMPQRLAWQPMNVGPITHATSTSQSSRR